MFIDSTTSAETPVTFKFEYNSDEGAFGFLNEAGEFVSFSNGSSIDISDTTATSGTVLSGYDFYTSEGIKTSGTIVSRSATNITISGSQTYYSGFYPSNWTVTGLNTSDATAAAKNIESGKTAYVNGVKITGTAIVYHGLIKYSGSITNLSALRVYLAATSIGNYALFGGGNYSSTYRNTVDAYNTSLSRSTPTTLSVGRSDLAATNIGNYALFGGGYAGSTNYLNTVDAYNTSLVRSTPTVLSTGRSRLAATNIGDYALFGGGYAYYSTGSGACFSEVVTYDTSLTKSTATYFSAGRQRLRATSNSNYAIFAGGENDRSYLQNTVEAYNTSLSKSTPTTLSQYVREPGATNIGNYALFAGGVSSSTSSSSGSSSNIVDAYNNSLTKSSATVLYESKGNPVATKITNYALFAGGSVASIDAYNASLIRSNNVELAKAKNSLAATSIGDYALFGGGSDTTFSSTVEAYYEV